MKTDLFDYDLPNSFIAQQPAEPRESSRLMVLHRKDGRIEHRRFSDIVEYLNGGDDYMMAPDLLVANNSRVIPARIYGRKPTGGKVEIFLLKQIDADGLLWECLTRGRNLKMGSTIERLGSDEDGLAEIVMVHETGTRHVRFDRQPYGFGDVPLPPYITEYVGDAERYQTIYNKLEGSAAAPTAGLHFSVDLLADLHKRGVALETVTLHVGLDTFRPVEAEDVDEHMIHSEWATLSAETAKRINETALMRGRVVAVGTTSVRTLEWAATRAQGVDPYDGDACPWQRVAAFESSVDLYIRPGYRFRAVDALVTNFHLPKSSLLMLVSAFVGHGMANADPDAGRQVLLKAYEVAKAEGYRFYSFGDAMLIV